MFRADEYQLKQDPGKEDKPPDASNSLKNSSGGDFWRISEFIVDC